MGKVWSFIIKSRVKKALQLRRNDKDNFRNENGYSWDYVIIFKVFDADEATTEVQKQFNTKYILSRLAEGNLEVRLFYSLKRDNVYCKIRAPIRRLLREADINEYKLQTNPSILKRYCTKPNEDIPNRNFDPLTIPEVNLETNIPPYDNIYLTLDYENEQYDNYHKKLKLIDCDINDSELTVLSLFEKWKTITLERMEGKGVESAVENKDIEMVSLRRNDQQQHSHNEWVTGDVQQQQHYSLLRDVDRLKLIHNIINSKTEGGCYLDVSKLLSDDCILGYFPIHDHVTLSLLENNWIYLFQLPWRQNVDDAKNYFGEKIGFYFTWLGFLTTWSIVAGAAGFFAWITIEAQNDDPNSPQIPYFAGFMAVWATFYFEFWKRKEKSTAMKWGMIDSDKSAQIRPAFQGIKIPDAITGRPMIYFSPIRKTWRLIFAVVVTSIMLSIIIGCVAAIFKIRLALKDRRVAGQPIAGIVSSILLAIQIQICNELYFKLAFKLTDFENHRTDVEYEDSLNGKTFLFQFINSYISLFYTAFYKPFTTTDPCIGGCFAELRTLLGTIFISRLLSDIVSSTLIPMIMTHISLTITLRDASVSKGSKISEIEKTFAMPTYDVLMGPFQDYSSMIIHFGYMTMFVAAWPLTATLALFNSYAEMRISAFKLCHVYRRPEPRSCEDLGTWNSILELISYISVFINAALIAFTATNMVNINWHLRIWTFLIISLGLFGLKLIFAAIIPDTPIEIELQIKRQQYISDTILYNPDIDDEKNIEVVRSKTRYSILNTDYDV